MQALGKNGVRVDLSAVDKDGLDIEVPQPVTWTLETGEFTLTPAPNGLSAEIRPKGPTSTGTLVVHAGNLTATETITYTSTEPEQRFATKLNLVFTALDAAPEPGPGTPGEPVLTPGVVPTGAVPGAPVQVGVQPMTVTGTGTAAGTSGVPLNPAGQRVV